MPTPSIDTSLQAPAEADATRLARAPQQERGRQRVDQILDAAEQVLAAEGVGGTSMQMIAERAGSSVGSLYHFFPNKDAIVEALGARYANLVRLGNEAAMPLHLAHISREELFDRVFKAQVQLMERTPAFDVVHAAVQRNCKDVYDELNQALVGHVDKFLALRYPAMPAPVRTASAMVSVATVHAMVELIGQLPPEMREGAVRESHAMMIRHYAVYDEQYGSQTR